MDAEMLSTQLQWLLLKDMAQTLMENKDAIEQKLIKGELVAGRQTHGYEVVFNYNELITINRIWVDKQLNLPLKWEITYPGFKTEEGKIIPEEKIVTYFIDLEINPELGDEIFIFNIEPHQEYDLDTAHADDSEPEYSEILNQEELKNIPYSFTYRDNHQALRLVNFNQGTNGILVDGVSSYAINEKENLIAFVLLNDTYYYGELVLFDIAKNEKRVIILNQPAGVDSDSWCPNGRYLLLDFGTDVFRGTFLYNLAENEFKPWNEGRFGEALWSPDGGALAYGIPEIVTPETPVGAGYSVTTVVRHLNDGHAIQTIIKGASDYHTYPVRWKDQNTLIINKFFYEGFQVNFFEADVLSGQIREISEQEARSNTPYPGPRVHVSPDGKYGLSISDDKIQLQIIEKGSIIDLFKGDMPRWHINPTHNEYLIQIQFGFLNYKQLPIPVN
jgi:hypothetical protein